MEGIEGEMVWESLKMNPELFLNEALNSVDDLLDNAFHFFHSEACKRLQIKDADRSQMLAEGTAYVRNMIVAGLDVRLETWKQYCLRHCFRVPEGFRLPEDESAGESPFIQYLLSDPDLDAELESLREKVTKARKESAELFSELQALERQSARKERCTVLVHELLQLNEETSVDDMSRELAGVESELRANIEKLGSSCMRDIEHKRAKRSHDWNINMPIVEHSQGLFQGKLEEIHELLTDIKRM